MAPAGPRVAVASTGRRLPTDGPNRRTNRPRLACRRISATTSDVDRSGELRTGPTPSGRVHHAALDGLRGVSLLAVVAFHASFDWARGGYLGVSAFFTLSGFLITSLLLDEVRTTGGVALGAFWTRRLRRLLPAAALTLLAVSLAATALATADQLARLRGDVLASLFSVVNWRFLDQGRDYGALFTAPSPVLHFWSLAIEGQFYVLFPLLVAWTARRRRVLVAVIGALVIAGTAVAATASSTTAYYATLTRAPELLVGALLAIALALRQPPRWLRAVGIVALAAMAWAWSALPVGSTMLGQGGFLLHALATAAVLAAALQGGPLGRALSWAPLVGLGRISYGVYLFHWPIFVWLDETRIGVGGKALVAVEVALAVVLAALSWRFVERPVRHGRLALRHAPLAAAVVAAAAVLAVAVTPGRAEQFTIDAPEPAPTAAAPSVPRFAFFGDSTALRVAFAMPKWGADSGRLVAFAGDLPLGCSLVRGGLIDATGSPNPPLDGCDDWPTRWSGLTTSLSFDAAVVLFGPWDTADRKLAGDDRWRALGDPRYDDVFRDEVREAVRVLSSNGAKVLWLTSPHVDLEREAVPRPSRPFPASDRRRMDRLNELVREVAAERPDVVRIVDLAGHLRSLPGGELSPELRPDGVHLSEAASFRVADFVGPALMEALASFPDRPAA